MNGSRNGFLPEWARWALIAVCIAVLAIAAYRRRAAAPPPPVPSGTVESWPAPRVTVADPYDVQPRIADMVKTAGVEFERVDPAFLELNGDGPFHADAFSAAYDGCPLVRTIRTERATGDIRHAEDTALDSVAETLLVYATRGDVRGLLDQSETLVATTDYVLADGRRVVPAVASSGGKLELKVIDDPVGHTWPPHTAFLLVSTRCEEEDAPDAPTP